MKSLPPKQHHGRTQPPTSNKILNKNESTKIPPNMSIFTYQKDGDNLGFEDVLLDIFEPLSH